ncbi:MAG: hydroxymethylbilane synthase [Solirubrobacteraceae bacterium]|nr:hydroxymethylbilane synthase [Solirubrobacteraceae bacterium]
MRIGTRRSALALAQAELIAALLGGGELIPIVTSGDRGAQGEDKSRWVHELEQALSDGEIDIAVHSAKDVPGELAEGLELIGAPARGAAEDVICGASDLAQLPAGACVGTSSIRRAGQLLAARADLQLLALRGNVDTRLRKLADPSEGLHAIVLARAGLQRLGRESEAGGTLDPRRFITAPGQGVLALQGRHDDQRARSAASAITDQSTFACLAAERALARELGASCHTPLGANAVAVGEGTLRLRAWVGLPDGSAWVSDELEGAAAHADALGRALAERMRLVGADELLGDAEEMARVAGR